MKVLIHYTIDADERYRRAINHHFGETRMATRKEVKEFCRRYGETADDDILSEYDDHLLKLES